MQGLRCHYLVVVKTLMGRKGTVIETILGALGLLMLWILAFSVPFLIQLIIMIPFFIVSECKVAIKKLFLKNK